MSDLKNAAKNVICNCLDVKSGESVLIVIDEHTKIVGYALWEEAKIVGAEVMIIQMTPREINGEEPPKAVAEAMKSVDVVIAPTYKSITHTKARIEACENGARVATMPGITEDIMIRTLNANYNEIYERSVKLGKKLNNAKNIRLTTPLGTDIAMNFEGRKFKASTGIIRGNNWGNLPGAEVFTAPIEGTSNGIIYIDGSIATIGLIESQPVKVIVKDGYAVKIEGGIEAEKLITFLDKVGPDAYNIAELGIGTNHLAKLTGLILEDEKILGTVHVALGNNISMGGVIDVPIHLDGVINNPTLVVDGEVLMKNGVLKI